MMRDIQTFGSASLIAKELQVSESDVESYFRTYYINRFFPIRDLTPDEMSLVKFYLELKYTAAASRQK